MENSEGSRWLCRCKWGGVSWMPFEGQSVYDKAAGRFYISYYECGRCHAVQATVVDRGHWERLDFSMEYRWEAVLDGERPYRFPRAVSKAMANEYIGPAVFRWVNRTEETFHMGETDSLSRYVRSLARQSKRPTRLGRALHSSASRGADIRIDVLKISPYKLGKLTMSSIGLRDMATRQFMWQMIIADSRLRALAKG